MAIRGMGRARRVGVTFAVAAAALAVGAPARAHEVFPLAITLRPGAQDYVFVADLLGCPATITARTSDAAKVTVFAIDMGTGALIPGDGTSATTPGRVDQVFVVTAASSIAAATSATIEVCWVGEDYPDPPCNENSCSPYAPRVVTITIDPHARTSGATLAAGFAGDPVNTATGELFMPEPADLDLGGPFPLVFQRTYASRLESDGNAAGALGPNWLHGFEWKLVQTGNNVEVVTDTGRVVRFEKGFLETSWRLTPYQDAPYELVQSGGEWRLGEGLTGRIYVFDTSGRLASVADGRGNVHTLSYTGADLTQIADGLGRTLTFSYSSGRLASVTDGTRTVAFAYTGGELTGVTDAAGKVTTYDYILGGALLAAKVLPTGRMPLTQSYLLGRVTSQTTPETYTTSFTYDLPGGRTSITDPLGGVEEHAHDGAARMTGYEDEAGSDAALAYDAAGRRRSITDRLGRTTSFSYHTTSGFVSQITEADGSRTTLTYTARAVNGLTFHDLTRIARADGTTEQFTHDAQGNVVAWTDPAGEVWGYTYDARGRILTATNPEGGVTTCAYHADGTLASVEDDAGNVTTLEYDALRRPVRVVYPDATDVEYTYDARDRLLTLDEGGRVTTFDHDDDGYLTQLTDPLGDFHTFDHDANGRLARVTDSGGTFDVALFDELGRTRSVTDGLGNTLTFGHDARGRLSTLTDELGNVWRETRDAEGVRSSRTDPLGKTTRFTSDALGRITAVTSPLGDVTRFTYDALGRLTHVRDPLDRVTSIAHDARGLVSGVTLPVAGASSTFVRNGLGQITQATAPGGNVRTFAYDAQGRRTGESDALGNSITYEYDSRNRVSRVVFPRGMGTLDLTYDAAGRLARQLHSDGTDLQYVYDDAGNLTSFDGGTFEYGPNGRMVESNGIYGDIGHVQLAPGYVSYSYDERGLVTSVTDWVGGATTLAYDDAGRLVSLTRPNGLVTTYAYDADDHLVRIQEGTIGEISLSRGAKGNVISAMRDLPLSAVPALGTSTYSYDAAGQVAGFTYDALGQLLDDGTRTYTWDLASRLRSVTQAGATTTFEYDAAGMLIRRSDGATTRDFVWNYLFGLPTIDVVREGAVDLVYYVRLPTGQVLHSVAADGTRRFFHADELGGTTFLSDEGGAVVKSFAYDPYGRLLAIGGAGGDSAFPEPFTWQGAFYDFATGLYYMRQRWYDPVVGRFLSRDPVGGLDPVSASSYTFAGANPVRYTDPLGLTPVLALDVTTPQVQIESRIAEVDLDFARQLGVPWAAGAPAPGPGGQGGAPTTILSDIRAAVLRRALSNDQTAQVLAARPGTTVAQGAANLSIGQDLGFVADADRLAAKAAGANVSPLPPSGVQLELRPEVDPASGGVRLEITPRGAVSLLPVVLPRAPENAREVIAKFRLSRLMAQLVLARFQVHRPAAPPAFVLTRDLLPAAVLGGLTVPSLRTAARASGIPGLGSLPILGQLFRERGRPENRPELLLFLTPRVLRGE